MEKRTCFICLLIWIAAHLILYATIWPNKASYSRKCNLITYSSMYKSREMLFNHVADIRIAPQLKKLAEDLIETQRNLKSAPEYFKLGLHIRKVFEMLNAINETKLPSSNSPTLVDFPAHDEKGDAEVCPEVFKGKKLNYGYPFFRKGFERVDCKNFVPIEKLVTVLISMSEELHRPAQTYQEVMKGVEKYYPNIQVILATGNALKDYVKSAILKMNIAFDNEVIGDAGQGALWERLIRKVKTKYVLIAPDITHFDDDINLERMVRVLSYEPQMAVVGGAHRNLKGEWDIGCQQVSYRNYTATYMGGYYRSFNDCVVCDFLSGPIMAKTKTLKKVKLDANLKFGAFHDLFWRLKKDKRGRYTASCPDVMFNVNSLDVSDDQYVSFANKHQIHKIVEPSGKVRWYGCRHGLPYTSANLCEKSKGMALSPAEMENLADVIKYFMQECDKAGAFCEIQDGTLMGAVKFNGVLPWDVDGDITFLAANFSVLEKLKDKVAKAGYILIPEKRPTVENGRASGGYFTLKTTNWNVELWGYADFDTVIDTAAGRTPTKVLFSGQWLNHPHNPGLFARNRYGAGIYQHQEHWTRNGQDTGWIFYNPGKFHKCPHPGHTGCLDQYPADGNMQFRRYCS